MNVVEQLIEKKLISPPHFLAKNLHYLTMMGSVAYGVSSDTSDMDIYGFCIPTKEILFPHLAGVIPGFGDQGEKFEQYQQHHAFDKDAMGGKGRMYDFTIYNIVKYFELCKQCNPNMIDSLYTPTNCVLHITRIGQMVKDSRKLFLHKGAWHTFKGYAYQQIHKMDVKQHKGFEEVMEFERIQMVPHTVKFSDVEAEIEARKLGGKKEDDRLARLNDSLLGLYHTLYKNMMDHSKRAERVKIDGYDVKFAYHVVRLLDEIEQIMVEHDVDLMRNREQLKSIRRGEWTAGEVRDHFTRREKELAKVYDECKLPHKPDERPLKKLLLACLEEHYGNLSDCVVKVDEHKQTLDEIVSLLRQRKVI